MKIGIIVGSLRKGSYSKIVAKEMQKLFPTEQCETVFLDIAELPLYNPDLEDGVAPPQEYEAFRQQAKECDGFLFVTPEYNRSLPAAIKNAIDVGSRPYGNNVWDKKTAAVVSVSPGKLSGFGANQHLRQCLVVLNTITMQQPEAYIGNVIDLIEDGRIANQGTLDFLKNIVDSFIKLTITFLQ